MTSRHPPQRNLRSLFVRSVVQGLLVVIGLGVVAIAATSYQRSWFESTTGQFERETRAIVELTTAISSVDVIISDVFYGFGSPEHLEQQLAAFEAVHAEVDARFGQVADDVPSRGEWDHLRASQDAWEALAVEVRAAPASWGTDEVVDALAEGQDPYADAWASWQASQRQLVGMLGESTTALGTRAAEVRRLQAITAVGVGAALLATVVASMATAHRVRRGLIEPLLRIREAATRMHGGDLSARVRLRGATGELQELADTMNELAGSLQVSHGELQEQALTDALTGLPNRAAIIDHVQDRLDRRLGDELTVLFIDLDDFKSVNDTWGHAAGDQLLEVVARRLRACARGADLVGRLGGDEFVIVVRTDAGAPSAQQMAERILDVLDEPVALPAGPVAITASIGLAGPDAPSDSASELLTHADVAMYLAKNRGKHRLERYAPDLHEQVAHQRRFTLDLRQAAELDQLEIHYQPVVDVADRRVLGYEALVRWRHPERGLLAPGEFVPLAQDSGDVVAIDDWVLDRVCRDLVAFPSRLAGTRPWVSANVSTLRLQTGDLASELRRVLRRHGAPASRLMVEITEAVPITDLDRVARTLGDLRRAGVRVAIDDFGVGYSSLRYLQHLPVDVLKVDGSFLAATVDADGRDLLGAIVQLGRTAGMAMIVEGVEDVGQLARLQELGDLACQGYLIGRPAPLGPSSAVPSPLDDVPVAGP